MTTSDISLTPRPFGRTGLLIPPLCVGCAPLGNMPETFGLGVTEEQAVATLRAAFDSPITFFDTSAIYGFGESERRIGLALRAHGGLPPDVVIATKADRDPDTGDFSGTQIRRSVEESMARLGLDHLPLVYIHDPEHTTFENIMGPGGALEVLQAFRDQGVIGSIGISGGPIDMMIRYVETSAFAAAITHNRYTLLNRSAGPLLDVAATMGVAVANAAPYNSGILVRGPDGPDPRYAYRDAPPELLERARRMAAICAEHGVPLAAAALQFSLRDPRVGSTVVGLISPEQVAQTVEWARHPIPAELWPALDAVGFTLEDPEIGRWG
jgi:D-threo-aldose 1-dehydrogenase